MEKKFEQCLKGDHTWKIIDSVRCSGNIDEVTEWCSVCGCIVIIQESDGRFVGRAMEIQGPATYKLYQKTERELKEVSNALHVKKIRSDWRL
jgi:hypothetical protein